MTTLSVLRERHIAALERDLAALVAQLRAMPAVRRVILFGSYAAGRRDLFTDLDLLIVMDTSLDFVSRIAELTRLLKAEVPVDLLVYTPEEMERMRDRPFIRHALATGKVLYEREAGERGEALVTAGPD
ncbi:MAG: nucleotidyltransferase domain-containing protein [Anaerolineae bacterium]|nr:nucleotidyltransferase domain-containing protein [Caldilineales bacterium]MDW8270530.1 nucleotidyltransferase domain-containing protein [Anaerolineae bacterium]